MTEIVKDAHDCELTDEDLMAALLWRGISSFPRADELPDVVP